MGLTLTSRFYGESDYIGMVFLAVVCLACVICFTIVWNLKGHEAANGKRNTHLWWKKHEEQVINNETAPKQIRIRAGVLASSIFAACAVIAFIGLLLLIVFGGYDMKPI
jgi:hypothetical protein